MEETSGEIFSNYTLKKIIKKNYNFHFFPSVNFLFNDYNLIDPDNLIEFCKKIISYIKC